MQKLIQIWTKGRNSKPNTRSLILVCFFSLATGLSVYALFSSNSSAILQSKSVSTNLRLIRWKNTLEMFKEHPMGVGPNNYEFAYLSYKDRIESDFEITEKVLVKSAHNGYLELFCEYGVIFGFVFLVLLVCLLIQFSRIKTKLYFFFTLFFCINALFAFPMELPISSYMIALFVGAGISEISVNGAVYELNYRRFCRILALPFFLATTIVSLSLLSSNLFENKFQSELFCNLTPSIWRNCLDAAVDNISSGNFNKSSEILKEHLELYPNNFMAQRFYAFSLSKLGRTKEACDQLSRYDHIFLNKSSISEIKAKQCSEFYPELKIKN